MAAVFVAMSLVAETGARLVARGYEPITFVSPNVPGVEKDHNQQVFEENRPESPQWSLVTGTGSKHEAVGAVPNMKFGVAKPGFMMLAFRTDGAIELHVYAAPDTYQLCGDAKGEDVATCMRDGPDQYTEVYASELRNAHATTVAADSGKAQ